MEDTLGAEEVVMSFMSSNVLILVLMEDTLGAIIPAISIGLAIVLILVLMEDTLGDCDLTIGNADIEKS